MRRWLCLLLCLAGCSVVDETHPSLMSTDDAMAMERPSADQKVFYGDGALHFAELRVPDGDGPFPVVIVIHGGCWLAEYDLGYMSGLAESLADRGYATWNVEYRRVGDEGGGWPGTFEDIAASADFLATFADEARLDLGRVVALGHSAGGHLALWLAGRHALSDGDELRGAKPLVIRGVVALAGIPDLAAYSAPTGCGAAIPKLLGGEPHDVPERVRRASPAEMVPLGVPQILLAGGLDPIVDVSYAESYADEAVEAGDTVSLRIVEDAGHFELVNPDDSAFVEIENALRELVAGS